MQLLERTCEDALAAGEMAQGFVYRLRRGIPGRRTTMPESVYKVIELVGTSTESWEKAAAAAVARASKSLRELRVAEVSQLDMQMEGGKVKSYRARIKVSFKYEGEK
jgi:flavin-binding protein dodecin